MKQTRWNQVDDFRVSVFRVSLGQPALLAMGRVYYMLLQRVVAAPRNIARAKSIVLSSERQNIPDEQFLASAKEDLETLAVGQAAVAAAAAAAAAAAGDGAVIAVDVGIAHAAVAECACIADIGEDCYCSRHKRVVTISILGIMHSLSTD